MKKKYLLLRCASQKSMNAQLEVYDDHKQVRKKSSPNSVIFMKSVAGVKRIEAPVAFGSTLKDCGCFIRLDVSTDRGGVEEVYLSLDNRDLFEDWLTDLEFLVRLPDLIIPLPYVPKRGLPLITQTSIDKKLLGDIDFGINSVLCSLVPLYLFCRGCLSRGDPADRAGTEVAAQQPYLYSCPYTDDSCILGPARWHTCAHIQCN